jgi:PiT family inorganic phosphate transporter
MNRRKRRLLSFGQIASASLMAFSHGAQDGQKFMGVFFLALTIGASTPLIPTAP